MYVYQLAKELMEHGHDCLVLSVSNEVISEEYDGIHIKYIPFEEQAYNDTEHPKNLDALLKIVNEYVPDVFHLHTSTPSLGINHLKKLSENKIITIFTAHITSFSCIRGDLMLNGLSVCDGLLDRDRCLNCYMLNQDIKSSIIRKVILNISKFNFSKNINSPIKIYTNKLNSLDKYQRYVEHIFVVSKWQQEVLLKNNFNKNKLSVCRQAVNESIIIEQKKYSKSKVLKIGFVGRVVKVKGLKYVLEVLKKINSNNVEFHIAAIKSNNESKYYEEVRQLASSENVIWNEDLDFNQIIAFLDRIDLLVLPSTWLETGPYVLFEAFARKVPVLAFNKGGATELIEDNINGWLEENNDQFENKLSALIKNKELVTIASENIKHVRTTKDLYNDVIKVYNNLMQINPN